MLAHAPLPIVRRAVALGRQALDPLALLSSLCGRGQEVLALTLHQLQAQVRVLRLCGTWRRRGCQEHVQPVPALPAAAAVAAAAVCATNHLPVHSNSHPSPADPRGRPADDGGARAVHRRQPSGGGPQRGGSLLLAGRAAAVCAWVSALRVDGRGGGCGAGGRYRPGCGAWAAGRQLPRRPACPSMHFVASPPQPLLPLPPYLSSPPASAWAPAKRRRCCTACSARAGLWSRVRR